MQKEEPEESEQWDVGKAERKVKMSKDESNGKYRIVGVKGGD